MNIRIERQNAPVTFVDEGVLPTGISLLQKLKEIAQTNVRIERIARCEVNFRDGLCFVE